jgi:hypothetical protein
MSSVCLLLERGKQIEKLMNNAQGDMRKIEEETGKQFSYFKMQWKRQREMQLLIIETATERKTRQQVEELVHLEDRLQEIKSE